MNFRYQLTLTYSELQVHYPNLVTLRTLVSGIPMPREGEDIEEILITVPPTPPPESIIPQHWPSLLTTLSKLQGEGTIENYVMTSFLKFR